MASRAIQGNFNIEFPLTRIPAKPRGSKRVWYKPNHRSFGAFMRSDQMRDVTNEVAVDIAALASMLTPANKPGAKEHTGLHARVKSGFKVKRDAGLLKVGGNLRVRVLVENDAEGAALVEFGAPHVDRQRMLGTAALGFGDFHQWGEEG